MAPATGNQSNYHVLLVGIDAYTGVDPLNGCVNDIDLIQRVLVDKLGVPRERIRRLAAPRFGARHETDVPEELPTLANLRAALDRLASDAVARGDRVFIHYSGHGTQATLVDANGRAHHREALLPNDHRRGLDRLYLFDWELNARLARIAQRTDAITVILDCCCSAGATRDAFDAGSPPPANARVRYVRSTEPVSLPSEELPAEGLGARGLARNVEFCQVIAACLDDERARESDVRGGLMNGELTRALVDQLDKVPAADLAELRWGRIWRAIVAAVSAVNRAQHPVMWGDFARRVFGGPIENGDAGFSVARDGDTYRVDVGSLSGVTDSALVAVYPSTPLVLPAIGSAADHAARAGLLRVTHAARASAEATAVQQPFDVPAGARGRLVEAGFGARLVVALASPDNALAAAIGASPLLRLAPEAREGGSPDAPDVTLVRRNDGGWAITDDVFGAGDVTGEPVLAVIPHAAILRVRAMLEHYHAYATPLRLAKGCFDLPRALHLRVLDCNGVAPLTPEQAQHPDLPEVRPGIRAPFELRARKGDTAGDKICFVVENRSDVSLRVALIDCQASGSVCILGQTKLPARVEHTFWLDEELGVPFEATLPEELDLGVDRLVLVGTTDLDASLRHLEVPQSFGHILRGTTVGTMRGDQKCIDQWTATVTALRMVR